VIKTRGSFPNADAARKLLYLALEHIAKKVDHAGAELEGGVTALRHFARRLRPAKGIGVDSPI
jgi:transposase-like protein